VSDVDPCMTVDIGVTAGPTPEIAAVARPAVGGVIVSTIAAQPVAAVVGGRTSTLTAIRPAVPQVGGTTRLTAGVTAPTPSVGHVGLIGTPGPPGPPGPEGPEGPAGPPGSGVAIIGSIEETDPPPVDPSTGDMWVLGDPVPSWAPPSATGPAQPGDGIVWDGDEWINTGQIQGPSGPPGESGLLPQFHIDGATSWFTATEPGMYSTDKIVQPTVFAPLYIYPSYLGWWDPYYANPPDWGVVNVAGGPGTAPNSDYTLGINTLRGLGSKLLGYVDTNYGAVLLTTVKADIDLWFSLYNVDGIFFDRVPTGASAPEITYMADAAAYAKAKQAGWKVAFNHGDYPIVSDYATVADFSIVFENTYTVYTTFAIPSYATYVPGFPASQWVHLVHACPDETSMRDAAARCTAFDVANFYATADANFAEIPPYYSAEFDLATGQQAAPDARWSSGTLTVFQGLSDDLMQMWMGDNTNTWFRVYTAEFNAWSAWTTSVRLPSEAGQTLVSVDDGFGGFTFYPGPYVSGDDANEVFIGPDDPGTDVGFELWYDVDDEGTGAGLSYVHHQTLLTTVWTIVHNLGWFPNVLVIDSAGANVEGDITQVDHNSMRIQFSASFTGTAYLS